ncbi:MAG TPA: DNA alkylation repair protein [Terriglobia bacterium]|nr:DNA alkylation repair protein [Terriglobia bacterium]
MTAEQVLDRLRALASAAVVRSLARFAIPTNNALGVSTLPQRKLAREIGRSHALAQALWKTGILEARGIAALIDDATLVTEAQAERWVRDFDSWAVCDGCCFELFDKTPFAWRKALEWSRREREFEKRAGFALMAALARHDRGAADARFKRFLAAIRRESGDPRNFVRKAVNWALREIGKRNLRLNRVAVREAREIRALGTPSARWIAADALRELTSAAVQLRLKAKSKGRGQVQTRRKRLSKRRRETDV